MPLPVDETLLQPCQEPRMPVVGGQRRDNETAYVDAYEKFFVCRDRHGRLVTVVRKAQEPVKP